MLSEAILMSTHNIQFHDKIRKFPLNICFLELSEELRRSQKRVRIIHGKRAIELSRFYCINLEGVCSLATYSVPYEETQSNRVTDFRDFVCSLFPKAIIFYF